MWTIPDDGNYECSDKKEKEKPTSFTAGSATLSLFTAPLLTRQADTWV